VELAETAVTVILAVLEEGVDVAVYRAVAGVAVEYPH
jgi:hypothetical protein